MFRCKPLDATHINQTFIWRKKKHVQKFFPGEVRDIDKHTTWFMNALSDQSKSLWVVEALKNDIGLVWLEDISEKNSKAEFGFYIGEEVSLNTGAAIFAEHFILDYAFHRLGLNKVYCETLAYNDSVLTLHQKFGFQKDGTLRQHVEKNGIFHDVVVMSILQEEFKKSEQPIKELISKLVSRE